MIRRRGSSRGEPAARATLLLSLTAPLLEVKAFLLLCCGNLSALLWPSLRFLCVSLGSSLFGFVV